MMTTVELLYLAFDLLGLLAVVIMLHATENRGIEIVAKKATVKKPPPVEIEESEPEQYGARPSKATICVFCEHLYIKPCTVKTKDKCPNYLHLQSKGKEKKK